MQRLHDSVGKTSQMLYVFDPDTAGVAVNGYKVHLFVMHDDM